MSEATQTPIVGQYVDGPVEISWSIGGSGYTECALLLKFNDDQVGKNTLHPDNVNWSTGKHEASNGWLELDLQMTVPTADQEGALELVRLAWEEAGHGEQLVENIQLVTWTPSGA